MVVFTVPVVYGNMGKACFTTNDPKLAEAMKNSPMFGVNYFVKEEIADVKKRKYMVRQQMSAVANSLLPVLAVSYTHLTLPTKAVG